MFYKKGILFFLFYFFSIGIQAQKNEVDSTYINNLLDSIDAQVVSAQTFRWAEEILGLSKGDEFLEAKMIALNEKGEYYYLIGQIEKSVAVFQELAKTGEKNKEESAIFDANYGLGFAFAKMKMLEESLFYFKNCEKSSQKNNDLESLITTYNAIGYAYGEVNNLEKALEFHLKAKKLVLETNLTFELPQINSNIGLTYAEMGRADLGIPFLEEILILEKQLEDTIELALSYANLAYAFHRNNEFEKALMYYDSSLFYSKKMSTDETTFLTYFDLSEAYEQQKDFKNALKFHRKYQLLKDTVYTYRTRRQTNELEKLFQKERREKEILRKEKEVSELRTAKERLYFLVAGLIALLTIGLLVFLKKRGDAKREKKLFQINKQLIQTQLENEQLISKNLHQELQNKQTDLTNLALDIARKNEFSDDLIAKLNDLKKNKKENLSAKLKELTLFVSSNLRINEDLALLQTNISNINQTFYKRLDENFGNLTSNDKYLLGLIRLNLSNKDVAIIKGISPSSAKVMRHRLRKKLKLTPDMDFADFLRGF